MKHARRRLTAFRVRWEIDVDASSAREAARLARRLQVVPRTTALVFDAWPRHAPSHTKRIDLSVDRSRGLEATDVLQAVIEAFPGLLDGETDVNGADLVDCLTRQLADLADHEAFMEGRPGRLRP